jgi:hypothetical protein
METANQTNTGNFNEELTQLRGANEAMIQIIEALTRIVENMVAAHVVQEEATNTPITNGSNLENPLLEDEQKSPIDPTFTRIVTVR